ncbi:MAG: tetratricopeptide repeat protein [Candidatus Hydrogenedentes bacterium]|nr:tetratricopeptide repeat protein [Candidatus Hydrogenedentota bacterium]
MSDPSKQKTSSLDEDTLKALEAAEAGLPSPLLDDGFLAHTDFLDDNTPLVLKNEEERVTAAAAGIAPAPPRRRALRTTARLRKSSQDTEASSHEEHSTPVTETEATAPTPQEYQEENHEEFTPLSTDVSTETSSSSAQETEDINDREAWLADEAPLEQSLLDNMVAAEERRRQKSSDRTDPSESISGDDEKHPSAKTGTTHPPAEAPSENADAAMSQDDLDALIAGQEESPPEEKTEAVGDDAPISQDDLDALITGQEESAPEEKAEPVGDDAPMSQDDLDALIAGQEESVSEEKTEPVGDDAPISQDDLDALITGQEESAPEEKAENADPDTPLSQDDLEALITEQADTPSSDDLEEEATAADPSADSEGTLSQADLDALLATTEGNDSNQAVSLDDNKMDGLFDEKTGEPKDSQNDGPVDQSDIDALIAGSDDEQVLDGTQLDAPIIPEGGDEESEVSLSQSSIDSLMTSLDKPDTTGEISEDSDTPSETSEDEEMGDISQDMIDSLIASAQQEATDERGAASQSEIGSENLAAAATASDAGPDLLSQSDLDKLIETSKQQDQERDNAKERALEEAVDSVQTEAQGEEPPPESTPESFKPGTRFRKPSVLGAFIGENLMRLVACLLVGFLVSMGTGIFMALHMEIQPGIGSGKDIAALEIALERARFLLAAGGYTEVINELNGPIDRAYPGTLRNDALYVRLEAQYRGFRGDWGTAPFDKLIAEIDDTLKAAPSHPRAPEALHWKAKLFATDQPQAASDIYKEILEQYDDAPNRDRILLEAAQLALVLNDPLETAIFADNLLTNYPASIWAGEAKLARADANVKAGNLSDARTIFIRLAQEAPDSALGARAFVRLAKLAHDMGQYDIAKLHLKTRLETTTTLDGNDEVYLLLAKNYRATGQLEDARDTLNDLLSFFEDSSFRPDAFIEYAQVLEALGERERAIKAAQRAALEYPSHPGVLRNNGELQGLHGNPLAAAVAFVAADKAGAADPRLLLNAARYYRTANMPDEAAHTYARLKTFFAGSPESLSGGIEAAELRYKQGGAEGALDDLKALKAATQGTAHYLPTLEAMQTIYKDLGLDRYINDTAQEIISVTTEPEVLAEAAVDLIDTGDLENAQAAINKLDLNQLRPPTAFNVLMKEGNALLSIAPQRGLEKMEQAYFNYPDARTQASDQTLLRTYLATGRAAAARRMVMDLKAHVTDKPVDTPYLVDAAIAWGDFLYDKEDYRTAIFAFSIAEEASIGSSLPVAGLRSHPDWAKYQRANALLHLADYKGCLSIYEDIAASDSPWAKEAEVKANLARLEQRQRGASPTRAAQAG